MNKMELLLQVISCTLVHIPLALLRYVPFEHILDEKQKKKIFISYTAVFVLVAAIYMIVGENITVLLYKCMFIAVSAVLLCMNIIIIPGHWREHWFTAGLIGILVTVVYTATTFIEIQLFGITDLSVELTINGVFILAVFFLFRKAYCTLMCRTITPFLNIDSGDYWKEIWFIPGCMFLVCYSVVPVGEQPESLSLLISRTFLMAVTVVICNAISGDYQQIQEKLALAEQLSMQKEYYNALSERAAEVRKSRHDFKHHIAAIRKYIEEDDKSGLDMYCEDLTNQLRFQTEIPYTGNAVVDGLLYRYTTLSQEKEIRFTFSGMLGELDIADIDLCVLLGNALDNALAASMTASRDKFISVRAIIRGKVQKIVISNSFDGVITENDGKIMSRKRNGNPGIGLSSMQSICDKNQALMDIKYDENQFSVMILLNIKE